MADTKAKLLFVSKDMGAAEMGIPLAEAAKAEGYEVVMVVEGLAAARYESKGFSPFFKGTVDFRDIPFTLDGEALVKSVNPAVIIITMSSPINLEDQIGAAANTLGKPLVAVNDFWGGLTRAKKAKADLMLAIDEVDANAARTYFKHQFDIAVVGNHAVRKARALSPSKEIQEKMRNIRGRYRRVILFSGGGVDFTGPEIELLVSCLQLTPGSWVVIKRYHGKHMNRIAPDGRTYHKVWDEQFAPLGNHTIEVQTDEGDAVAALADCTISGFSTMMTTAVASYKRAISLVTPESTASLKKQTTLNRYALSVASLVPEVTTAQNLMPFIEEIRGTEEHHYRSAIDAFLKPYDPSLALEEIEKRFLR